MITLAEFKAFALKDLMSLERVISKVSYAHASGFRGFAIFDGGAHKGYHAENFCALPNCRKVYAVEADPHMADVLRDKMRARLEKQSPELVIIQKALQNDASVSSIRWKSSFSHVGRSSIASSNPEKETIWPEQDNVHYRDEMMVPATTIDTILAEEAGPIPFIKLDLEGADLLALFGARETLRRHRPIVVFENSFHAPKVHGFTLDTVINYFSELDYVPVALSGERMDSSNWFGMFEAFSAPREYAEWLMGRLPEFISQEMQKA